MRTGKKTEADLRPPVLEPGIYAFEVLKAEDQTSKGGNEMIYLLLKIFGTGGKESVVSDYLLNAMEFKLRHFAVGIGKETEYMSGAFTAADCIHQSGKVKIKIQPPKGDYAEKNVVEDYVVGGELVEKDPDVPF